MTRELHPNDRTSATHHLTAQLTLLPTGHEPPAKHKNKPKKHKPKQKKVPKKRRGR